MSFVLIETFSKDDTVTFLAMFNVMFGLMMCTLNFSEHVGHRFAAKYSYVFKDEFASDIKGLTVDEKKLQVALRRSFELKLKNLDPQEWRRKNQKGL